MVPLLNRILPAAVVGLAAVALEPRMMQLVMVLLLASLMKRMVLTEGPVEVLVLDSVRFVPPPPEFMPSMVTLSAPFRFINGAARFPVTLTLLAAVIITRLYTARP